MEAVFTEEPEGNTDREVWILEESKDAIFPSITHGNRCEESSAGFAVVESVVQSIRVKS